ncbi:MAG: methylmalonyl-CoA mutase family protein [Acidobacteria bacterium]|jgi:methylmalonyl-CoA mutase N-terminal domain/subunit|nr:methylmalonyl-CoA mutase family protein [Acidobacteriota bacterium]
MRSKNLKHWEETTLARALARAPEERGPFTTVSDLEVPRLGSPDSLPPGWDAAEKLGFPGEYPFTRGIHPTMYRSRLWTMRMFAGFGTAEDTNQRFKYLLGEGQTGLSTAFDLPTLMGRDSDDALSEGEVGREGVAVDTLADMEILFDGIPLGEVSTSMTINCSAPMLLAMYLAVAEKQGVPFDRLRGTVQNDILKEYIAQKEWIYPPLPSLRLIVDMIEYCSRSVPQWNTISISGYHIREAGSTAVQELAFTLADGFGYVEACLARGMKVDDFAPRLSFFWNSHNDFFEEVAKFRAARRIWATRMRDKYGARDPRSWMCRFHTQTAGCSLTAQQPLNNIARVTIQALAAVLGGTQSLHTDSFDETLCLPTETAVRVALRTQQIIAEESGVTNTIDPLGGAYFVEALTDRMERDALAYIERIEQLGGIVAAIERGYPQKEIADASFRYQQQIDRGEKVIVGVNKYQIPAEDDTPIEILRIAQVVEERQLARLAEVRARRDGPAVERALARLAEACRGDANTFEPILEAVRAYATVGEVAQTMKTVFGSWEETSVL